MEPTSSKELMIALATRLAKREIPEDRLEAAAKRIVRDGLKIGGVDFCPYGICIDYFGWGDRVSLDAVLKDTTFRVVKLFPYGILVDDLFRVQVEMHIPELAEHGVRG